MNVFAPGTIVTIGHPDTPIRAQVNSVLIESHEHVSYRVVWWDGSTRKSEYLDAREVSCQRPAEMHIGFRTGAESCSGR